MGLEVRDGGSQRDSKHMKDSMRGRFSVAGFELWEAAVARTPCSLWELGVTLLTAIKKMGTSALELQETEFGQ